MIKSNFDLLRAKAGRGVHMGGQASHHCRCRAANTQDFAAPVLQAELNGELKQFKK